MNVIPITSQPFDDFEFHHEGLARCTDKLQWRYATLLRAVKEAHAAAVVSGDAPIPAHKLRALMQTALKEVGEQA